MTTELKLGRRPAKNAPALRLGNLLTGAVPDHPLIVDHLNIGGWQMLGNDQYGDCVAVTWANYRRLLTRLTGNEQYPGMDEVVTTYKTQNPNFPQDDGGMDIQTLLEYLVKQGGPDGVKAVAFAKVDHTNPDEVKAAIAIFGAVWVGITVQAANMDQFRSGLPWDYVPNSRDEGGHSVIVGGYDSDGTGGDENFVTWASETAFTDSFWANCVDEAWVVVWPENLGTAQFQQGIDLQLMKEDFHMLTGRDIVLPNPTPTPTPGVAPFSGADPAVADKVAHAAAHAHSNVTDWLNHHFRVYFHLS